MVLFVVYLMYIKSIFTAYPFCFPLFWDIYILFSCQVIRHICVYVNNNKQTKRNCYPFSSSSSGTLFVNKFMDRKYSYGFWYIHCKTGCHLICLSILMLIKVHCVYWVQHILTGLEFLIKFYNIYKTPLYSYC